MTGRLWRVVGGSGGGLLVRESHELTSTEVVERLATQSIVEELEAENAENPLEFPWDFLVSTKQKLVAGFLNQKHFEGILTSTISRFYAGIKL